MRCVIGTPLGHYAIEAEEGCITHIDCTGDALCPPEGALLTEAARQLTAYVEGTQTHFDLTLRPCGTA